jgi:hypothetical protein
MLLIIGLSLQAFRLTVRYVTLVGISDGQNLLQHPHISFRTPSKQDSSILPSSSLWPMTKDGCPIARSSLAREREALSCQGLSGYRVGLSSVSWGGASPGVFPQLRFGLSPLWAAGDT